METEEPRNLLKTILVCAACGLLMLAALPACVILFSWIFTRAGFPSPGGYGLLLGLLLWPIVMYAAAFPVARWIQRKQANQQRRGFEVIFGKRERK